MKRHSNPLRKDFHDKTVHGDSGAVLQQFLEHLRSVHFTLIATSFALLVTAAIRPSGSLERAYEQSQLTSGLMRKVFAGSNLDSFSSRSHVPFLVDSTYYQPLSEAQLLMDSLIENMPKVFGLTSAQLQIQGGSWGGNVQTVGNFWILPFGSHGSKDEGTLKDFRQTWEFYRNASAVTLDGHKWQDQPKFYYRGKPVINIDEKKLQQHSSASSLPFVMRNLTFALRLEKNQTRNFSPWHWYVVVEIDWQNEEVALAVDEIWFPVSARKATEIDVQSELMPANEGLRMTGAYEDVFGDLKYFANGLESMHTNAVVSFLRERFREVDKKVQILGVEIPQSALSQWGLLVLIACESYLALHLVRAQEYWKTKIPSFPWIALYSGVLAKFTALGSVTILPISATFLLCLQGVEGTENWMMKLVICTAAFLSLLLTTVIIRFWPRP